MKISYVKNKNIISHGSLLWVLLKIWVWHKIHKHKAKNIFFIDKATKRKIKKMLKDKIGLIVLRNNMKTLINNNIIYGKLMYDKALPIIIWILAYFIKNLFSHLIYFQ